MLESCLGIKLALDDDDECGICEECVGVLRVANDFKLKVLHSQTELRKQLHIKDKKPDLLGMLEEDDTMIYMPKPHDPLEDENSYGKINGNSEPTTVEMSVGTGDDLMTQKPYRGSFTRKLVYNFWRKHNTTNTTSTERANLVFKDFIKCLGIQGEQTLNLVRDQIKYVCEEIEDRLKYSDTQKDFIKENNRWLNSSIVISKVDSREDFVVCKKCDAVTYRKARKRRGVCSVLDAKLPRVHAVCSGERPVPRRVKRRAASV